MIRSFADKGVRSILVQIGVWTAIGIYALNLDNAAHLGGFVSGFAATWVMSSAPEARRNGWLAIGAGVAALFVFAARPWWTPAGRDANDLVAIASAFLEGNVATPDEHLERMGAPDAAAKSKALRQRASELDPGLEQQQH